MTMAPNLRFQSRYGPWAVVTGASSGIGRAMAEQLAVAGLHLVLVARGESELEMVARQIGARHGVNTEVLAADLRVAADIDRVKDVASSREVGLLVAAAGFGTSGQFIKARVQDERDMLAVNCLAVMELSLHFGRRFADQHRGGIVLFGSLLGYQGAPNAAQYAATKAYVQTLAEALHVELAPEGVDVLSSAPGPVRSGFAGRADMRMSAAETPETVARATVRALGRSMTVTPGPLSKLLTWGLMTAPRSLRTRIMGRIMGGMTRHQSAEASSS